MGITEAVSHIYISKKISHAGFVYTVIGTEKRTPVAA